MMDHTNGWMGGWTGGMWLMALGGAMIVILLIIIVMKMRPGRR